MFVTNWISTTKIQKISEITNFFRHYFLSRTEVFIDQGMPQGERLVKLNQIAIQQMRVLEDDGDDRKYLK